MVVGVNVVNGMVDQNGDRDKYWYLDGKLHRVDGPAIIYYSGIKKWYIHGELHRIGGPAIEYTDGTGMWYLYGKLHRTDGPAVEYYNGERMWYLHGIFYLKNKFDIKINQTGLAKELFVL